MFFVNSLFYLTSFKICVSSICVSLKFIWMRWIIWMSWRIKLLKSSYCCFRISQEEIGIGNLLERCSCRSSWLMGLLFSFVHSLKSGKIVNNFKKVVSQSILGVRKCYAYLHKLTSLLYNFAFLSHTRIRSGNASFLAFFFTHLTWTPCTVVHFS